MKKSKNKKQPDDELRSSLVYSVKDLVRAAPQIELTSNKNATIEGSKGVLEYSDNMIRVGFGSYSAAFSGRGLSLKCISPTALVIDGFILNIEFTF